MQTIHKFPLAVDDVQTLKFALNTEFLAIQNQNNIPCLWAMVDLYATEHETRAIVMFGTGTHIPDNIAMKLKYISTFQMMSGGLVFHAFEQLK